MIQRGHIFKKNRAWFGRWRRDERVRDADGNWSIERRQHCEKLCDYGGKYRSKEDVQPLLDRKLQPLNEGRESPESTLSVAEYGDKHFLPYADRELKPSTAEGYRALWRMYLRPWLTKEKISLRDFRCADATDMLKAIHDEHHLNRKSLRNCKALLSTIFTHAKRTGVLDGGNPVQGAGIPRAAERGKPTHAYSADEVLLMLDALHGIARTAVALIYFCGLRPGEARAARWEDYDGKTLRIRASVWRTHTTLPKTAESVAPVPVAETLAEILRESQRESGYILAPPPEVTIPAHAICAECRKRKWEHKDSGHEFTPLPVDLHNLAARVVVPALSVCAECRKPEQEHGDGHEFKRLVEWHGWYALRRGLATLATSIDSQLAAKSLLRHSNVQTTQQFYIKSIPEDALRAIEKVDALFQKTTGAAVN
ncbi:MAG TPA: site-specific integrase [Candidatus Sulfotelmatobacter sp.]|nr:site-specific integrase [Candidatus Sulfotelmatobacter sp.]